MKYVIFIALIIILVTSFFIPKNHHKAIPPTGFDKDDVITLDRTSCFGTCPDYSLIIRGDGSVVYEGRSFVRVTGKQEGTIGSEDFKKLVDEFYEINYFSFKSVYDAAISDLPSTTTSITINGKTTKVMNRYGGPEELVKLENDIDKVVNIEKWTKELVELGPMRKLTN